MQPVKPGYTTTEFWVTVATNIAAILLLFAPNLSERIGSQWVQPFAILAAGIATVVYTLTRGKVKSVAAHPLAYAPVPSQPFASHQADEGATESSSGTLSTPPPVDHRDSPYKTKSVSKTAARKRGSVR